MNRRRMEANMWITLAQFAGSLLILALCATAVSCCRISCRIHKDRNDSNQTRTVNLEIPDV